MMYKIFVSTGTDISARTATAEPWRMIVTQRVQLDVEKFTAET